MPDSEIDDKSDSESPLKDRSSDVKKRLKRSRDDGRRSDKHKRKKHKKHRKSEQHDSSSDSESSSDSSRRHRRHRKRKESKKQKSSRKHSHKRRRADSSSNNSASDNDDHDTNKPSFGKYGILKASDKSRMQRSFEMWVEQVKGVTGRTSTHEEQRLWEDFREDFNTATLPHKKYYDYDKWELEEHMKNGSNGGGMMAPDERARLDRLQSKAKAEKALLLATMNSGKIQDMRRQAEMRSQMQAAYKMGDMTTYQKIKDKLEADE